MSSSNRSTVSSKHLTTVLPFSIETRGGYLLRTTCMRSAGEILRRIEVSTRKTYRSTSSFLPLTKRTRFLVRSRLFAPLFQRRNFLKRNTRNYSRLKCSIVKERRSYAFRFAVLTTNQSQCPRSHESRAPTKCENIL